ncbi:MAG: LysR family transcriptional regulator [Rhodospirillales bacterium]|nr:LysR family transcriptional regulator [Rhodospirillales bacterium]
MKKSSINLRHLRVFIAVVETGSFSRAAEELLLSQSSMTVTIRQLEEELGVRLLNRTTRQVRITPDGEKFLENARHVIDAFDRMIAAMRLSASQLGGTVKVAVLPSVAIRLLPNVITHMKETNEGIRIVLSDDNARGLHRQVRENEVDFGIGNKWGEYPELEYVPLTEDRFGVVCRADDPLTKIDPPLSWGDVDPERVFTMAADTGIPVALMSAPELEGFLGRTAGDVLVMVTLLEMVRVGLGITVLPELARPRETDTDLVYIPLANPVVKRKLCLIRRHNEPLSPGARRVWETLRALTPKSIE